MPRIALLALVCAVLLAAFVWFWAGESSPLQAGPTAAEVLSMEEPAAVVPLASLPEEVRRSAVEPAGEAPVGEPVDEPAAARLEVGVLRVRVFGGGRLPLPGAKVGVAEGKGGSRVVEGHVGGLGESVTTGPDGLAEFRLPPERELRGWVRAASVGYEGESFVIEPLDAGSTRELVISLRPGTMTPYHARLVDRETGEPVAGAVLTSPNNSGSFSFGAMQDEWSEARAWEPADGDPAATTGPDGEFTLEKSSLRIEAFEVHAQGYGPAWVQPNEAFASPDHAEVVRISRTGVISGSIVAGVLGSGELVVGVLGSQFALRDNERSGNVFFMGQLLWRAEVQASGAYRIEDVPAGAELQLQVRAGSETLHRAPRALELEPGEELVYDWRVGGGSVVQGRLVREDGASQPTTEVWLVPAEQSNAAVSVLSKYEEPVMRCSSVPDGSFVFEDVAAGSYFIGPAPSSSIRNGASVYAVRVQVPASAEVLVPIPTELTIEGRVTLDGEPVADATVYASQTDTRGGPQTESDREGRFRLGPLPSGTWRLHASRLNSSEGNLAGGTPVEVPAGSQDVELSVLLAATLAGEVVDGATGRPVPAHLCLRADGRAALRTGGPRQTFEFDSLRAGNYTIHAWSSDGTVGMLEVGELGPGDALTELVVELAPGGTVRVTTKQTGSRATVGFERDGAEVATIWMSSEISNAIGLPAGTYTVTKRATYFAELTAFGEVTVVLGEEVVIDLDAD